METVGKIAGWSEDQLKGYMQTYGYVWSPEIYWEIVITIRLNQRRAKENAEQPVGDWDRYYEFCPVCGEPTIPDPSRDRKFGAAFGWKCTVNPNHFIEWRFAHLKGYMTRHAGEIDKWEQAYGRGEYVQDEAG